MLVVQEIFMTFFPILPMLWLVYAAQSFSNIIETGKFKRAKIVIDRISDLWPKNLRWKVTGSGIKSSSVEDFMNAYQKVVIASCTYLIACLVHFALLVVRSICAVQNYYRFTGNDSSGLVFRFVCISLVVSYIFFIEPVGKLVLGRGKFEAVYETIIDGITTWAKLIIASSVEFALSFIMLYLYVIHAEGFLDKYQIGTPFWTKLAMLMVYQYVILAVISILLSSMLRKISSWLNKKSFADTWLQLYITDDKLYQILKNSTYISLVLVYAVAEESNSPVAAIIGVLFLIDTYIDNNKKIRGLI